jgi:hypothetical protein
VDVAVAVVLWALFLVCLLRRWQVFPAFAVVRASLRVPVAALPKADLVSLPCLAFRKAVVPAVPAST